MKNSNATLAPESILVGTPIYGRFGGQTGWEWTERLATPLEKELARARCNFCGEQSLRQEVFQDYPDKVYIKQFCPHCAKENFFERG